VGPLRILACVVAAAVCALAVYQNLPDLRTPSLSPICRPEALIPSVRITGADPVLAVPGRHLVARLARYDDELFGYLVTSYLRGTNTFRDWEVLLTAREENGHMVYPVMAKFKGADVPRGLYTVYTAQARGLVPLADWHFAPDSLIETYRRQDHVFEVVYSLPVRRRLEHLTSAELIRYASRFVRFKSSSDPRTWLRGIASLEPLTTGKARELSGDIVSVANFYSLPLDFFMGIAAMENNYMNARGDINHAVWKARAQAGDLVLARMPGRVLVRNYSIGVWQITRETLRKAHQLYLEDHRDYSQLPAGLIPPRRLNLESVDPRVLTTYAGMLFRNLLDRCDGDVSKAVGAYNGGLANPNYLYAAGVGAAATHARSFIEHAAVLGAPAAGMQFVAAGREGYGPMRDYAR
jgi:hypothetical protein